MDRFDSDPLCSVEQIEKTVEGDRSVEFIALGPMRQVVGSGRVLEINGEWRLADVYVRDEYRRRGVGTAITRAAKRWAAEKTVPLYLHVQPDNEPARALYEQCGFSETERPHIKALGEDLIWMVG